MKLACVCLTTLFLFSGSIVQAQREQILPEPRNVRYGSGSIPIHGLVVTFTSSPTAEDRFAAAELARGLAQETGARIPILAASRAPRAIVLDRTGGADALPVPGEKAGPESRESYRVAIDAHGIRITGRSSAGVYYGVQTLLQLAKGTGNAATFPEVAIQDWPSLPYRATLVDVGSEGPMSTVAQIEKQLDLIARFKGNQYLFYCEACVQFDGYPLLNPRAQFTKNQVRQIIAYGRERHIEIVPAVELFGHLHDLFRIERYSSLADFPHGGEFNPANPDVKVLLQDWISQLSALFPSPFVDIGFDETFSIQKAAESAGAGATPVKLFLDQLRLVTNQFQAHGKQVMAYADIMVKFPGIIPDLPPGLIALPWYYDAKPDPEYKQWLNPLVEHHVPHIVVSGVSSWDEIAPDFDTTFENIDTLLAAGRRSGTLGLVNTVWTDDGQLLMQMSWPGIAYGAASAWQSQPLQQSSFFAAYSRVLYSPAVAASIAQAYTELNAAEQSLQAALGEETMSAVWRDPFEPRTMEQLRKNRDNLRQCRLHAENAEEDVYRIEPSGEMPEGLPSLMVGAQLLDYAGMKYLYALEIADSWATLPPQPTKAELADVLAQGISSQVHSRTADLMDAISALQQSYKRQWLDQYTDYRLYSALGRWNAEYEYWRRAQARFTELRNGFHDHDTLPSLEQLLGDSPVM